MARQSSRRWIAATLGAALLLLLLAALVSLPGLATEPEKDQVRVAVDRQAAQQAWADARALSSAAGN